MPPKKKNNGNPINQLLPPTIDLDHIPLAGRKYKITETKCEFDLFELYCWFEDNFIDQTDEIGLWESNLPFYVETNPIFY